MKRIRTWSCLFGPKSLVPTRLPMQVLCFYERLARLHVLTKPPHRRINTAIIRCLSTYKYTIQPRRELFNFQLVLITQ